jgi:23S rRNA (cytidine2498-2'-O)-methyltransferase
VISGQGLLDAILLYCRPGFEKECASDIVQQAALLGVHGYVRAIKDSGHIRFVAAEGGAALQDHLRFSDLIFARQLIHQIGEIDDLPPHDRLSPIMAMIDQSGLRFSDVFMETADTNDAKSLSVLLRKFKVPLRRALEKKALLGNEHLPRLHVFFESGTEVVLGFSNPRNASPWPMGIPRLKFPAGAPSRSTLKLDEAFQFFLAHPDEALVPGMTAVDLGAAPGGWTYQLVRRHIRTVAVDNGPMDSRLLDSGIVQHARADGFRYRPLKPVDWLVCDMVEQPHRVAALVADWLAEGACREAIFNLKLPMKKRYDCVGECRSIIEDRLAQADRRVVIAFKQLYHDRQEITGYATRGRS